MLGSMTRAHLIRYWCALIDPEPWNILTQHALGNLCRSAFIFGRMHAIEVYAQSNLILEKILCVTLSNKNQQRRNGAIYMAITLTARKFGIVVKNHGMKTENI